VPEVRDGAGASSADGAGGIDEAQVTMYFDPVADAPPVAGDAKEQAS